jgi:hypothetical protein
MSERGEAELRNIRNALIDGMPIGMWDQLVIDFTDAVDRFLDDFTEEGAARDIEDMNDRIKEIRYEYMDSWRNEGYDDEVPVPATINFSIGRRMDNLLALLRLRFSGGGRARLEETLRGCGMSYLLHGGALTLRDTRRLILQYAGLIQQHRYTYDEVADILASIIYLVNQIGAGSADSIVAELIRWVEHIGDAGEGERRIRQSHKTEILEIIDRLLQRLDSAPVGGRMNHI